MNSIVGETGCIVGKETERCDFIHDVIRILIIYVAVRNIYYELPRSIIFE